MAVSERLRNAVGEVLDRDGLKPPPQVEERIKRGRDRAKEFAPYDDECWHFFRGEQYSSVSSEHYLVKQSTVTNPDGTGKPSHRIRRAYNLIQPIVAHKVSAAASRTPAYEINPSTPDPADRGAATLAGKVARYGYEQWKLRQVSIDVYTRALISRAGFAWPYFDTSIGPFIQGEGIGIGDVKVRTFGSKEVFWEPGVRFENSPWHGVEQARPIEEVKALDGYMAGDLAPDAEGKGKLVLVTDYLERPTAKNPQGRWLTIANRRQICQSKDYPLVDGKGRVLDEPVLHKLSFITDPEEDRDMGLVQHLLDTQRAFNHANCKQAEWIQLALNPQVIVKNGKLRQKLNDIPGAVFEMWGSGDVSWRPVPQIPPELQQIKDDARSVMQFIAADQDIPQGVEAARGIQALLERDQEVWANFYGAVGEFHSRLMRHCLLLVQGFYTEPRLLTIRGDFGVDPIKDFQGADLRGQADVTVLPGSIEPRTRKEIEAKVFAYADRQWITPEQAMEAIENGTVEGIVRSHELDENRAIRIISQIREGPQILFQNPEVVVGIEPDMIPAPPGQIDPQTGAPIQGEQPNPNAGQPKTAPNWMPRFNDNIRVWKTTFDDWFKTEEYENLEPGMQEAANQVYAGILQIDAQKQQQAAEQQQQMASGLGMSNAAKPQGPSAMPDQSQPQGEQAAPTQNQPPAQSTP